MHSSHSKAALKSKHNTEAENVRPTKVARSNQLLTEHCIKNKAITQDAIKDFSTS